MGASADERKAMRARDVVCYGDLILADLADLCRRHGEKEERRERRERLLAL